MTKRQRMEALRAKKRQETAQLSSSGNKPDGYDSEDDAWVDCTDPRVRPYEAPKPAAGGDDAAAKEAASKGAAERDRARRFAEQRKIDARSLHSAAAAADRR